MTDMTVASFSVPEPRRLARAPVSLRTSPMVRGSVAAAILAFLIIPDSEIAAKSFKANLIARNLSAWATTSLSD